MRRRSQKSAIIGTTGALGGTSEAVITSSAEAAAAAAVTFTETAIDRHCRVCNIPSISRMIKCDKCDNWYHVNCVGVTTDVEHQDFLCLSCVEPKGGVKRKTSTKVPPPVPPVSTHTNVAGSFLLPLPPPHSVENSEAALQDVSVYVVEQTAVNTTTLPNDPFTAARKLALANEAPPFTYAPSDACVLPHTYASTVTNTQFAPLPPVVASSTTVPMRTTTQHNTFSIPSLSLPFAIPPPTLSVPFGAILPPITCAPVYNPEVFKQAQCFTVPSISDQPIPSLQYNTPLSSRNAPIISQTERTTRIHAPTETGNDLADTKKQVRGEVSSQRSGATSSRMSRKEKRLQLELQILDEERKLQEEEQAKKREYFQKKHTLMREIADDSTTEDEAEEFGKDDQGLNNKVNQWIQGLPSLEPVHIQQHPQNDGFRPQRTVQQTHVLPQPAVQQKQLPPQNTAAQTHLLSSLPPQLASYRNQFPLHTTVEQIQSVPQPVVEVNQLPPQTNVQPTQLPPQVTLQQYQLQQQPQAHQHLPPSQPLWHQQYQIVPEIGQLRIGETTQLPSRIENTGANAGGFHPAQRSTPRQTALVEEDENNLSRSQVAARQAVSRELPSFSGIPEEWPLFYSTFVTTTNMCGYTSEENLVRLQKCLKGKAYEAVRCRLMHPTNVPGIISTLKMLFGNPDVIVHNLIEKIKGTPPPKWDRLDTLIEFSLSVQNLCATIEACQLDEYAYNPVLLRELVDKLPSTIKVDWAKYRRTLPCVSLTTFSTWLYDFAETVCPIATLPSVESKAIRGKKDPVYLNAHSEEAEGNQRTRTSQVVKSMSSTLSAKLCVICKGSCPSVDKCDRFAELGYNSRWATLKEFGLCRKCLRKHKASCKSQQVCGKDGCQYKHHQLLHNTQRNSATATSEPSEVPAPINVQSSTARECHTHLKLTNQTLFRVVPVILYGLHKTVRTHAFLDDGSQLTLIDATLASELNLKGESEPLCLRWTGNQGRSENESLRLSVEISGTGENHKKYHLQEVHTVANLDLFQQSINVNELVEQYPYLRGVPVESYQDVQPRILIGVNHANLTLPLKGREGGWGQPIATKTRLGWIIHGGTEPNGDFVGYHSPQRCPCNSTSDSALHKAVSEYFSIENIGICKPKYSLTSTENLRAENILKTIRQAESGHYVTNLLWKFEEFRLPNSKPMALQRMRCLESRLKKDPELATVLQLKVNEYLEKGYIRKMSEDESKQTRQRIWYLPIFPVFNPNKPGKVRIVWDAAAKTNGVSLNSMLLTGPDQLTSLVSVLIQFRENKVAICGDLREMFHQVHIAKEDQDCQRFLWRERPTDPEPSTFVMQVMTFGACCSPSCAQYVKNLNAENHAGQYPAAAKAITKSHYVDDMLVSTETEEEAIQLAKDVRHVHAQAGFEMRNWISNSPAVLSALQNEPTDEKNLNLGSALATEKVLGMWWCTATDSLTFKLSQKHDADLLSGKRRPTKREVLRTLMAIFDPLGLLSNLLIFLKILLQEIWRSGVGWDDEIPDNINEKWEHWLRVLPKVQDVRVPRCYRLLTSLGPDTNVQLHTFVDASEDGYAAVVYLRFQQGSSVECAIVAAKSRVAPLKFVSIPRLELQAAVVGARLANMVGNSLSFKVDEQFFWTDARNVLCWIRSDHRRYSQFVACRVSDILETTEISNWRWVGTKENVADEATKWQRLPDLETESRWFKGPQFIWQEQDNWPIEPVTTGSTKEEIRAHLFHHSSVMKPCVNVKNFSNWKRLVGTVAFVFRFLKNSRGKITGIEREDGPLSSTELKQAANYLFRVAQREAYPEEICILANRNNATAKPVLKQSTIYTMNPFLDEQQVLRMRGRTSRCEFATMDARNPIILPKDHCITRLVVRSYHERYHHRNHETVVNELRQDFRIPKLRVVFRNVRANCQMCKNQKAVPNPPPMADLPKARLAAFSRPFSFVGVDYFGPLLVAVGRRSEKRWGVLVTCLTTRAIYIEVAHTLSADSCIMAMRNFMVRRGVPNQIYSDRGTNFVATSKELEAALLTLDQDRIVREIVSAKTEWCFLPPASPHMGGSWERLIQTVKRNLQQIQPHRLLNDETLRNLLVEIEGTINSRPLTHVPADDPDAPVLTPNHFLLGSSSGLKPATLFDDSDTTLKRSWRTSQLEADIFWRRWVRDYLPELTRRTKWHGDVKAIEVGDIVVIVDPGHPRNCWPKGRVISVNKSKDDKIRSAAVQTATGGVYERPVVKLAVLDVRRDEQVSHDSGVPGGDCDDPSVGAPH